MDAKVHLRHSAAHWKGRCIQETSSDDENTPPNVASGPRRGACDATSDTGTATPPWLSPGQSQRRATEEPTAEPIPGTPLAPRVCRSPTTSSPILLDSPPWPPARPSPARGLRSRRPEHRTRREAAAPYARPRSVPQRPDRRARHPRAPPATDTSQTHAQRTTSRTVDEFVPARWPSRVIHLREHYNPLAVVFPVVSHFGWCDCPTPCRVDSCRNSLMHLYCNVNCCPYDGLCGNGLAESPKLFLGKSVRTKALGVVAAENIDAGEVLGQYLGEMEHCPERPSWPVKVVINAEKMGGLMRFVNHSCEPVAKFVEVANGRRTTVVVATTKRIRRGQEITVDYGDDLWFVCRCRLDRCCHRDIQIQEDP